jgi:hypothetical protein
LFLEAVLLVRSMKLLAVVGAALCSVLALWDAVTGIGLREGSALGLTESATVKYSGGVQHVGQELLVVWGELYNEASVPIRILNVSFDDRSLENVEVVDIGVIAEQLEPDAIPMGTYQISPPSIHLGGTCLVRGVGKLNGTLLPNEKKTLAFHVRYERPGAWHFKNPDVYYEIEGKLFYETMRIERSGTVIPSKEPVRVRSVQARCAEPNDVLPGNHL